MLDLSPTKLVIIFVVAVVLLGPKRLPQVARQLGAGWRKVQDAYHRADRELRQAIPDLPSSHDLVRYARSPVSLLNQLADGGRDELVEDPAAPAFGSAGSPGAPDARHGSANGHEDHWPEDGASGGVLHDVPAAPPATGGARGSAAEHDGWGLPWLSEPAQLGLDDPSLN